MVLLGGTTSFFFFFFPFHTFFLANRIESSYEATWHSIVFLASDIVLVTMRSLFFFFFSGSTFIIVRMMLRVHFFFFFLRSEKDKREVMFSFFSSFSDF